MSINGVFCIQRRLQRSESFQIADIAECCFIREVLMIAVALPNLEKARGLYSSYRMRAGETAHTFIIVPQESNMNNDMARHCIACESRYIVVSIANLRHNAQVITDDCFDNGVYLRK